jgi:Ulp1 family protease
MGKGESHFALASIILEYLDYEQQTIRSSNNSQCVFAVEDWKVIAKAVPNQFDGVNCGVFVILFMFRMMKDVKSQIFKEFDFNKKFNMIYMDQVRKKLVDIVFRRADLGDLESFT